MKLSIISTCFLQLEFSCLFSFQILLLFHLILLVTSLLQISYNVEIANYIKIRIAAKPTAKYAITILKIISSKYQSPFNLMITQSIMSEMTIMAQIPAYIIGTNNHNNINDKCGVSCPSHRSISIQYPTTRYIRTAKTIQNITICYHH